jgi:hypothetical protein
MRRGIVLLVMAFGSEAFGSQDSIGPNGINSVGLGLTGAGIGIGQVEEDRPAKPLVDSPMFVDPTTVPADVFRRNGAAVPNANLDDHAQQVAGVMISTDGTRTSEEKGTSLAL